MCTHKPGNGSTADLARHAHIVATAAGALVLGVDGYDIISVSVAAPGIAEQWGLGRSQLGWILGTEVMGAALGATFLGNLADVHGRRKVILACLLIMTLGMVITSIVRDPVTLGIIRFITGIGLGGLNPAATSMVSEMANEQRRDHSVAMLGLGYAIGAILAGASASWILSFAPWQTIFLTGAGVTAVAFVVAARFIPEPQTQGPAADTDQTSDALGDRPSFFTLLRRPHARNVLLLTLASVAQLSTFYFSLKWLPKLAVDAGMSSSAAALVLTLFNVGGLAGLLAMGPLARRVGLKTFAVTAIASSGAALYFLALSLGDYTTTMAAACVSGILANAAFGGLYASVARAFPSKMRASGIGLTLGLGRAGSSLAPIITGTLFTLGATVPKVALAMTVSAIVAALLIAFSKIDY